MPISRRTSTLLAVASLAVVGTVYACGARRTPTQSVAAGDAASKVYVAPGTYDEFYSFLSGGYSGQVAVYGIPSGRLLKVIPVFSQFPEDGYGYNEETKPLFQTTYGFVPWEHANPDWSQVQGSILGHYGTEDEFFSPEKAKELEATLKGLGKDVEFHIYEGAHHAFFNDTRPEVYDAQASDTAWIRTLEFLRAKLG